MNKIVGFTISLKPIPHNDIDIFGAGLHIVHHTIGHFHLTIWGIGDIETCKTNSQQYTLSFPTTPSLLDRNALVTINNKSIIVENDWLGSIPIFYNPKTLTISTLPIKTISTHEIDPEGLFNYLTYGYSVFGKTALKDSLFMRFFSKLTLTDSGLSYIEKADPVTQELHIAEHSSPESCIQTIRDYIHTNENHIPGTIIIPTSGGYDSRFLNTCILDKTRIRSFSYGISAQQQDSYESKIAEYISKKLQITWEHVQLDNFFDHTQKWHTLFHHSTHLHGMYQIDFYNKIQRALGKQPCTVLSGIVGDLWSGKVRPSAVNTPKDLIHLSRNYGCAIPTKEIALNTDQTAITNFWLQSQPLLSTINGRIITLVRIKIILLSYLLSIPEYHGFPAWTPYLSLPVVLEILRLNDTERKNRLWQTTYFKKLNIFPESTSMKFNNMNDLEFTTGRHHAFPPLDIQYLETFINKNYLQNINATLHPSNFSNRVWNTWFDLCNAFDKNERQEQVSGKCSIPVTNKSIIQRVIRRLKNDVKQRMLSKLNPYLVAKALDLTQCSSLYD